MKLIICLTLLFIVSLSECRSPFPDHTDDKFVNEYLTVSNNYRAKHHADPLTIDPEAVALAKSRCGLNVHHEEPGFGENLFKSWNTWNELNSSKAAIGDWYNEWKQYDYNNPGYSSATGHFTQLVWKGSTHVGCARCSGQNGKMYETYVVCEYKPSGNMKMNGDDEGSFSQNVRRP